MSQASIQYNYTHEIMNLMSGGMTEPRIAVIGCGGAGTAIVDRLGGILRNVCTIAINTDRNSLALVGADKKIHIGTTITFGEDSRGFVEVAEYAVELSREEIKGALKNVDIIFIVAGLGGGTGSGIAHYVGDVAKKNGIVDFGIVVMPFSTEVGRRQVAEDNLYKLQQVTENTIVLDNDSLLRLSPDIHISEAFSVIDRTVAGIIDDIRDRMNRSFIAVIADNAHFLNNEFQQAHAEETMNYAMGVTDAEIESQVVV